MSKLYAVLPGWVTSIHDGQRHFVGAKELIQLYGAPMDRCIVFDNMEGRSPGRRRFAERFMEDMVKLRPRRDGHYILP